MQLLILQEHLHSATCRYVAVIYERISLEWRVVGFKLFFFEQLNVDFCIWAFRIEQVSHHGKSIKIFTPTVDKSWMKLWNFHLC